MSELILLLMLVVVALSLFVGAAVAVVKIAADASRLPVHTYVENHYHVVKSFDQELAELLEENP